MKKLDVALLTIFFYCAGMALSVQAAFGFEHPRYDIQAEVDTEKREVRASQTVTFTNNSRQSTDHLYFHLFPNRFYTEKEKRFANRFVGYFRANYFPEGFQESPVDLKSISADNQALQFVIEGDDETFLKVALGRTLAPGQSVKIEMSYRMNIPHHYGRFGWHENIVRLSRFYPILAVHNDSGWVKHPFYPFHRPFFSEAAFYSLDLVVPSDQVVIHSGDLKEQRAESASKKRLLIDAPVPIREMTVAMSPDYQVITDQLGEVTINSFYLPGDEGYGRQALENAKDLMKYFIDRFDTDYPYPTFSIVPVHLGYGGEQMSNMAFIDTRFYKLPKFLKRYFDFIISHETAHQWLYNLVGVNEYTQIWLEEGLTSFFISQHLERRYGPDAQVVEWPAWFKRWEWMLPKLTFKKAGDFRHKLLARSGYDRPVVGELASFSEPSTIFSLAYGKGSKIALMLQHYIGEEALDRVFKRIFKEYRFKNLDIDDFIRLCEQESGQDLSWFFTPWLKTSDKFDYAVNSVKGNVIKIEKRGDIVMPFEVRVDFRDGRSKTFVWQPSGEDIEHITVDDTERIVQVEIDPDEKILDIDHTNNSWPRVVNIHLVPYYLPLHDTPVFMPDNAYNLVVGPELYYGPGVKVSIQKPYDQILYAGTSYEFGEEFHHSRVGYQLNNIMNTQTALGFEVSNRHDLDGGEEDLVSGKMILRRELWPAQYGLTDINDHVSLYLLRNHGFNNRSAAAGEDARNIDYSRREESIVGTALTLNRSGPYLDPSEGYRISTLVESAGHFLGATQSFYRSAIDLSLYQKVTARSKVAFRAKYGWGYPNDKLLYHIGGIDGVRGYELKDIRGANTLLGSLEYRFPLVDNLKLSALDNVIGLESISGVAFVDAGQSWFSEFDDASLKKDAGFGLRFTFNIGSFLEKVMLRFDAAFPINDSDEDAKYWVGVNHAF